MRVNMPSILYSVFFASNSNLSKIFTDMGETHTHTKSFACKFDVNGHNRFNTPEMACAWAKLPIRERVPFAQECDLLISTVDRIINPDPCNVFGVQSFITRDPKVRIEGREAFTQWEKRCSEDDMLHAFHAFLNEIQGSNPSLPYSGLAATIRFSAAAHSAPTGPSTVHTSS
ncbi:hypothetical protein HWV62_27093 [Athelia sp. TMB]|nr:hypothetical protein HWV62_27093 [Athelia sp. TMB]